MFFTGKSKIYGVPVQSDRQGTHRLYRQRLRLDDPIDELQCIMEDPLREAEQALSDGDFAAADRLARGVLQAGTSYEALV